MTLRAVEVPFEVDLNGLALQKVLVFICFADALSCLLRSIEIPLRSLWSGPQRPKSRQALYGLHSFGSVEVPAEFGLYNIKRATSAWTSTAGQLDSSLLVL